MHQSIRIAALALAVVALLDDPAEARHRSRYRTYCACQCATSSTIGHPSTTTNVAPKPRIKLELATVGNPTRDRIMVRISATNEGISPVTWDTEFAALMRWSVSIGDGIDYRATEKHETIPQASQPLSPTRFIRLCPGQSISRDFDLTQGIKRFVTGHGSFAGPEGAVGHSPVAYEALVKYSIPEKSKTITVSVGYLDSEPDTIGGDTFQLYFGKTIKDAGLPEGFFDSNRLVFHLTD